MHSTYEQSAYLGRPTELFEIRYGDDPSEIVRVNRGERDLTIGGDLYLMHEGLERDTFSEDGNPDDAAQLTLKLQRNNPFADIYLNQNFRKEVTLKIRDVHLNDPDLQRRGLWSGRLTGVTWEYPYMVLGFERMSTALKHAGVSPRYQPFCRRTLYVGGCRVLKANYLVAGVIDTLNTNTYFQISAAAAHPDGYFTGGILEYDGFQRYILQHQGDLIWISRKILGMAPTDAVSLYPGCDRKAATCYVRFNNIANYGGFDFIPTKGPFEGNSLI